MFETDLWENVKSSNIEAVGVKGEWLIVKFKKGGSVYRYRGYADLYHDLVSSPSVGKMFNKEVLNFTKGEKLHLEEWPEE